MPTIREVALRAGVSVGTVSNVLGGTVRVSKRLRDRVLQAIEEMNYQPNHLARSLKIRETRMIGMVIRDITDPLSPDVLRGAEDAAWQHNYLLVTLNSNDQWKRERQILTALRTHRVDGILLSMSASPEDDYIRAVRDAGVPIVCLQSDTPALGLDCVVAGHFDGARECVRHLASLGHRWIGWVAPIDSDPQSQERFEGYRQGLHDAGLKFDEALVSRAGLQLLSRSPRPTAILTPDAVVAMTLQRAFDGILRCPQDVAIATFDDSRLCEMLQPRLTAVEQASHQMGLRAVELLIARIQDPGRPPVKEVVATNLRIRESSCPEQNKAASAE